MTGNATKGMRPRSLRLIGALAALLLCTSVPGAHAATVTVNGKIYDAGCSTQTGTTQTVNFGTLSNNVLTTPGSEVAPKAFSIEFKSCPAALKNVTVQFQGTADAGDASTFANAGTAKSVGVRLYQQGATTPVKPNGTVTLAISDSAAEFKMLGTAYSPKGKASAGSISVLVPIVVSYN